MSILAPTRTPAAILMSVERELTAEDVLSFAGADGSTPEPVCPKPIARLRASHHRAAQLVAAGHLSYTEISFAMGRGLSAITNLMRDPAFAQLVQYYQEQIAENFITDAQRLNAKLLDIADLATEEIRDRLEGEPPTNPIPTSELRQLATMGLDRTVAPPKTAQPVQTLPTQITFNIGNKELKQIQVIEHDDDQQPASGDPCDPS
jgi:hypothetical protein